MYDFACRNHVKLILVTLILCSLVCYVFCLEKKNKLVLDKYKNEFSVSDEAVYCNKLMAVVELTERCYHGEFNDIFLLDVQFFFLCQCTTQAVPLWVYNNNNTVALYFI